MDAYFAEANELHKERFIRKDGSPKDVCNVILNEDLLFSEGKEVMSIDLNKEEQNYNSFDSEFTIKARKNGKFGGLVGWFEADISEGTTLSTSPKEIATHWKQQLFKSNTNIEIIEGDVLWCRVECKPQFPNYRALELKIEIEIVLKEFKSEQVFFMN